jgi:hypothetical protein
MQHVGELEDYQNRYWCCSCCYYPSCCINTYRRWHGFDSESTRTSNATVWATVIPYSAHLNMNFVPFHWTQASTHSLSSNRCCNHVGWSYFIIFLHLNDVERCWVASSHCQQFFNFCCALRTEGYSFSDYLWISAPQSVQVVTHTWPE